jgi:16S rRNA (uracil1498-N3)-methyltransferase
LESGDTAAKVRWRRPGLAGKPGFSEPKPMARYDFRSPRLYVDQALQAGAAIALAKPQTHYLKDVLRLGPGDPVLLFNGRDGEWRGRLEPAGKRAVTLRLEAQTRPQTVAGDLHYMFAPLKRARLDYMVQKAVEMGVARLLPVMTRHTQAERVNVERMRANAIEAAEQCGVLRLPDIDEPAPLSRALAGLEADRLLVFCDEDAPIADPMAALASVSAASSLAVLVGPEGGFAEDERTLLLARRQVVRLALGPRILRADTAAVAALALVQAVLGDWRAAS